MKIVSQAAEAGFPRASQLFSLTPVEIAWELDAFAARERRANERIDALAWLTGRYAAIGVHAPRKYPNRPECVKRRAEPMTDADMKRVFLNLAGRSEDG